MCFDIIGNQKYHYVLLRSKIGHASKKLKWRRDVIFCLPIGHLLGCAGAAIEGGGTEGHCASSIGVANFTKVKMFVYYVADMSTGACL